MSSFEEQYHGQGGGYWFRERTGSLRAPQYESSSTEVLYGNPSLLSIVSWTLFDVWSDVVEFTLFFIEFVTFFPRENVNGVILASFI